MMIKGLTLIAGAAMTFFARSSEWTRAPKVAAGQTQLPGPPQHYFAFLSYSHKDSECADWLHEALEKYRVPRALVGRQTAVGIIPARFGAIFRDRSELAASGDLGHTIREALSASRCLIVLCSPEAAQSRWTNEEILAFRKAHPKGRVFAAIVDGEPFASEIKGREEEECFPPALKQKFDSRGRPTGKRAEPVAADLREGGSGRELGLLKIVAGMIGVGLDDLVQREQHRRHRRLTYIAAASLTGMVVTSGLAVFAFDKRDEARDQRREAEGLVGFMLGDLRDKLEPIGRLDALDAVGSRALEYFEKQNKSELTDDALAQRARALTLMGEIASLRGDLDGALRRYREAMASTGELARREPDDPQRLFDHAQNVFWVGDVAQKRGDLAGSEAAMREYKSLAERMIAIEPGNPKWQMEEKYADTNLGVLLYKQNRFAEAARQFERALATVESIAAANPGDEASQKSIPVTLAWLADAQFGEGRIDAAIAKRERQLTLLDRLAKTGNDVDYQDMEITARRALGRWLASRGSLRDGLQHARRGVAIAERLMPTEPQNMIWVEAAAGSRLDLAAILLASGDVQSAAVETRAGCDLSDRLVSRDANVDEWQLLAIDCLTRRAGVAAAGGAMAEASELSRRVVASTRAWKREDARKKAFALAEAYKLLGDVLARQGDRPAANSAWETGLALWPRPSRENPRQLALKAGLLSSLGRGAEARALTSRLDSIGYRQFI